MLKPEEDGEVREEADQIDSWAESLKLWKISIAESHKWQKIRITESHKWQKKGLQKVTNGKK